MGFLWLINLGLLAIPVGTTVGVLLGVQTHRAATGQSPLFVDNGVKTKSYCQKTLGISPPSKGDHYTLNPNQWGWDEGDPGSLCINVTTFNNETYASKATAPEFAVTWKFPPGPETAPVHAFPNCKVASGVFPTSFESIDKLMVDVEWSYGVGKNASTKTDEAELKDHMVNTNVAIDMFADSDKTQSQNSVKAAIEIMIWFAWYGAATQPLGLAEGAVTTTTLEGVEFSLYTGVNDPGQKVFTWVASEPVYSFKGDIAPLLNKITSSKKDTIYPAGEHYIGYMSLGSEALSANKSVTFHVPRLSVDIETSS